jgi:RimJ/RimL family protein N-acetyltransferase
MSLIDPDNRASIRVVEKTGSRFVKECDLNGSCCPVYGQAARG